MTLELFYLICFVLGLSLTVLAALGAFTHLHFGHFHFHFGHAAHAGHAVHAAAKSGIGPINGFTIAAFLCWFGGCGFLLTRYGSFVGTLVLIFAVVAGLAGGALIFWFLTHVLMAHEHALTAADTEMLGVLGMVSSIIRPDGVGEIQFSQNGTRRFAPARSDEGVAIPRDVEVVVMRYERGIAYVRPWEDVSSDWNETPESPTALPQSPN
jgi:hypothetical protein